MSVAWECDLPGHSWVIEVDDYDILYETCRRDDGSYHGDANIRGRVSPERAAAVRRAARAYETSRRGRAPRHGLRR